MLTPLPTLELVPIGVVHSPWKDKRSAPRQPAQARGVSGRIELRPGPEFEDALCDLDSWSHIWVLFWFHLNASWSAKVLPPRSTIKRGVFATRSPYRPNPLGMSVLKLERIEGRVLHVSDLDILDQTPVLDLKPYVAYTDAQPGANAGWLGQARELAGDPGPVYHVEWSPRACEQCEWLAPRIAFDLQGMACEALRAGPAPHAYRRIRVFERHSVLAVKDFRLHFVADGLTLRVFDVRSGYRPRVLADPDARPTESTPLAVHREFVALFGSRQPA